MSTQHTPGPWKMGINFTNEEAIIGPNGQVVADASWTGGSSCKLTIDNEADANLIVASPCLLEVLQSYSLPIDADNIALSCIEFGSEAVERELKRRAVIAKATGLEGPKTLPSDQIKAAAELRRLQSVNAGLLGALHYLSMQAPVLASLATARAAIAKETAPAVQRLPDDDTEGGAA